MKHAIAFSACAGALLLCAIAHGDVTLEERLSTQGTGALAIANMQGKTVTVISGNRARTESDLQMQSRLVNMFNRGGPRVEIVRLDQDKVFELQPKKKTYTESNLAEQRAQMQKVLDQQRQAQAQQQQTSSGLDEAKCEWSPPKVDVKQSGERNTFAGFEAERVTVTAVQSCKLRDTSQVCDFGMSLDQWLAPKFDANTEVLAYQRAYAEKLGIGVTASRDFAERAEMLFGNREALWRELSAKLKELKGYPVKSAIGFGIGGPQCQASGSAAEPATSGAGAGGIAGQLGGALGGLIGRKKDKAEAAAVSAPALLPGGLVPLMTVTGELISISNAAVDPATFQIPADFRKVDARE